MIGVSVVCRTLINGRTYTCRTSGRTFMEGPLDHRRGLFEVDGAVIERGLVVLLTSQLRPQENGVYRCLRPGLWLREESMGRDRERRFRTTSGLVYSDTFWVEVEPGEWVQSVADPVRDGEADVLVHRTPVLSKDVRTVLESCCHELGNVLVPLDRLPSTLPKALPRLWAVSDALKRLLG